MRDKLHIRDIDSALLRECKSSAALMGQTLREWVVDAIRIHAQQAPFTYVKKMEERAAVREELRRQADQVLSPKPNWDAVYQATKRK